MPWYVRWKIIDHLVQRDMLPLSANIILAIISVVGLFLNIYIFIIIIFTKQISANNILLIHLATVQTLLTFLYLLFLFPSIVYQGSWTSSIRAGCIIQGFFFTLLYPISLWTICCLNCDRFYAIAAPLHYSTIITTQKVTTVLLCGWAASILLSIPPLVGIAPFRYNNYLEFCVPDFATSNSIFYSTTFATITLLLPGIVIIGCNIKVLMIARYHRHRIAAAIYEVTISAQVTITHQRNPFFVPTETLPSSGGIRLRTRSPITSVLQIVGSLFFLYLPYYIYIIWDSTVVAIYGEKVPEIYKTKPFFIFISCTLLLCSTIINTILYGLKNKILRKTFQNYWRKMKTKNEINQEIQARTPSTCGSRRPSATNMPFQFRPLLHRRMSETYIEIHSNDFQNQKIKRIASELSCRPDDVIFPLYQETNTNNNSTELNQLTNFNTLQVPVRHNLNADGKVFNSTDISICNETPIRSSESLMSMQIVSLPKQIFTRNQPKLKTTLNSANLLLQKVFRFEQIDIKTVLTNSTENLGSSNLNLKSPKILITKALSEDNDSVSSKTTSPQMEYFNKKYSLTRFSTKNSHMKLDRRKTNNEPMIKYFNLNNSSNSTSPSDHSHRRYYSLDELSIQSNDFIKDSNFEEQLLLSWPIDHKKVINSKLYGSKNIIHHPSVIFMNEQKHSEILW